MLFGSTFSPMYGYLNHAIQQYQTAKLVRTISSARSNSASDTSSSYFYKDSIDDHVSKNSDLCEQPNVILIFTEGLSQNIIDDDRNIMPNVAAYQDEGFSFTNYYSNTYSSQNSVI